MRWYYLSLALKVRQKQSNKIVFRTVSLVMEKLQAELDQLLAQLNNEDEVKARLDTLFSVYPFNEYESL